MTTSNLQNTANELISVLLKKNNFNNLNVDGEYITADSPLRNMVLLVVPIIYPNALVSPDNSIINKLKKKAESLNREAWLAKVSIKKNEIAVPVEWTNYSKT